MNLSFFCRKNKIWYSKLLSLCFINFVFMMNLKVMPMKLVEYWRKIKIILLISYHFDLIFTFWTFWGFGVLGKVWTFTGTESFWVFTSVGSGHSTHFIILINKSIALSFTICFIGYHLGLEDSSVNKFFLRELFSENGLPFFVIKPIEILGHNKFFSSQFWSVEFLQHRQLINNL